MFVITSDGRKIILDWLNAGRFFGGATLVSTPYRYLANTEVVSDSSVLVWDRKTIRELVSKIPRLLDNALSIAVTEHFAWAIATRISLVADDAAGRIASLLVGLACGIGEVGEDGIKIQVANEELAAGANVTPFTASRVLSEWQREGILKKARGRIFLQRPEMLIASRLPKESPESKPFIAREQRRASRAM
jgi:CRP-like cAMP-binding protein